MTRTNSIDSFDGSKKRLLALRRDQRVRESLNDADPPDRAYLLGISYSDSYTSAEFIARTRRRETDVQRLLMRERADARRRVFDTEESAAPRDRVMGLLIFGALVAMGLVGFYAFA